MTLKAVTGYCGHMVRDRAYRLLLITNKKWHIGFQMT